MGIRNSTTEGIACMVDSVTGTAFGPVFDSEADLDAFLAWYEKGQGTDPRTITTGALCLWYADWQNVREQGRPVIAFAIIVTAVGLAGIIAGWIHRGYHRRTWWQEWFDDVFGDLP